jgi:hypothetical protein
LGPFENMDRDSSSVLKFEKYKTSVIRT